MAVGGQLAVDGLAQVQIADDGGGGQIKDLLHSGLDLLVGHNAGTESIHHDGDRLGNADGVGQLDFALLGKAGSNNVFGDPACSVGG